MTDPLTGAATIVGLSIAAKPALDLVKDFLGRVLAPTADALGQPLAQPIVAWQKRRVERASKLVADAAAIVAESGQEPQPVPGRLLMPILEKGSLEEEEELHRRWVDLLANAAMRCGSIHPSFVSALGELTALDVRVLDDIHNRSRPTHRRSNAVSVTTFSYFNLHTLEALASSGTEKQVVLYNLHRLAIIHRQFGRPNPDYRPPFARVGLRNTEPPQFRTESEPLIDVEGEFFRLTAFGDAFVHACSRNDEAACMY